MQCHLRVRCQQLDCYIVAATVAGRLDAYVESTDAFEQMVVDPLVEVDRIPHHSDDRDGLCGLFEALPCIRGKNDNADDDDRYDDGSDDSSVCNSRYHIIEFERELISADSPRGPILILWRARDEELQAMIAILEIVGVPKDIRDTDSHSCQLAHGWIEVLIHHAVRER